MVIRVVARSAAQSLLDAGSELVVVKAQVKTGGRGKAGGVKLARTVEEAEARRFRARRDR